MLERERAAASFRAVLLAVSLVLAVAFPVGTASASVDGDPPLEEPDRQGAYYRRMGMFREAAEAYERYVDRSRAEGIGEAAFKEALAQAAGILSFKTMDTKPDANSVFYFVGIDGARFKKPVMPGDQLHLHVEILRQMRGIWKYKAEARVDGQVVAEAELMCAKRDIAE